LDIKRNFPCPEIKLKLEGKEKVKWYTQHQEKYGPDDHHYRTVTKEHKDSHKCYSNKFIIHKFNSNEIFTGQYQFPFSFILPDDLPSSFCYEWFEHDHSYAKIKYTCKVELENLQNKKDYLKEKINFVINSKTTSS